MVKREARRVVLSAPRHYSLGAVADCPVWNPLCLEPWRKRRGYRKSARRVRLWLFGVQERLTHLFEPCSEGLSLVCLECTG